MTYATVNLKKKTTKKKKEEENGKKQASDADSFSTSSFTATFPKSK